MTQSSPSLAQPELGYHYYNTKIQFNFSILISLTGQSINCKLALNYQQSAENEYFTFSL